MTKIVIGNATLYRGDCLEILPELEPIENAHAIFDPPYESHMHSAKKKDSAIRTDKGSELKAIDFDEIGQMRDPVTQELARITSGWFIAFCTPEGVAAWRDAIETAEMRYKRACAWYKPDSAPQFNGQGPAAALEMFVTAWSASGYSKWNRGGARNLWTRPTNSRDRTGVHPTEKPVALMRDLVMDFTQEGDTIIDPFMGVGTTGIAGISCGRKFIGIEKDEKYFDLAVRRIADCAPMEDLKQSGIETGRLV